MYSGSTAPAWGAVKLPHQVSISEIPFLNEKRTRKEPLSLIMLIILFVQLIAPSGVGSPNSQMDFLSELRRAMRNANAGS